MKGRVLRLGLAVLVAIMVLVGGFGLQEVMAQAPITLKMQASWPSGQTLYENFVMFAKRVEEMSAGRLKIETLPAGAIVPAYEVLDATSRGVIDGAHTSPAAWIGRSRAAIPISHGPLFGMDYIDFFGWYYHGGGIQFLNEWFQDELKSNVVAFPILPAGPQALGWFKKRIKTWADFKGQKFRIYGLGNEVFADAGLSVVLLPGGEILPAAERGVIDGAEWAGGIEDLRFGFHTVWKVHLTPGLHEQVTVSTLLINRDIWNKLPPDLKAIVDAAVVETFWKWWTGWHLQNADAYKEMIEKHKVEVYRTPDDILMTFLQTWERLRKKWAAEDPFFKKVIESQERYAAKVVPYRRSTWPPYQLLSDFYWKDQIYLKEAK